MTRTLKILLSISIIIIGWILNAFAWTTTVGHPISTVALFLGIGLFVGGIVSLIVTIKK